MSDHGFDDLPVLERLGESVSAAAARASAGRSPGGLARRLPPRALLAAIALMLLASAGSAAATLFALRGAVIPAPRATAPEQTPAAGSSHLVGFSVADTRRGEPRWTMRLATSRTGLVCSTVGQLVGGRFGIVGLDGRFRRLAPEYADACSVVRRNASSLVGARVFDARRPADARTVVSGVGGERLRSVTVSAVGSERRVPIRKDGTFLAVYPGLPEDLALEVRLRFADGHVERHPFGVGDLVFPDPDGGRAWKLDSVSVAGSPGTCVSLRPAREGSDPATSPWACGRLDAYRRRGVFFGIRRLTPGTSRVAVQPFGDGRWRDTPPRLLVWGEAGRDVRSIDVRGPRGAPRTGTSFRANGSFAYMFGPKVRVGQVVVTVRFRDGRTLVRRTSTGLIPPPTPGKGTP